MLRLGLDSETCGLYGMPVIFQFGEKNGPVTLYEIWKEPVWKTLRLIEWFMEQDLVGFNMAFDQFHVIKVYTIFRLLPSDWIPEEHIDEIAELETEAQDGPCVKPKSVCDLLLHSRKNEFQTLMAREDIRIRRVPTALAFVLAEELEKRVEIDGIYFSRRKDPDAPKWKVFDVYKDGELVEDFKDVVLSFSPAGGLKFLAEHVLGRKPKYHFEDVELSKEFRPIEYGYAPTARAVSSKEHNWEVWEPNDKGVPTLIGYAWPGVIKKHIEHWHSHPEAREYASDDIDYTLGLDDYFGVPKSNDDDSVLACMVAAVRWRGFKIDIVGINDLRQAAQSVVDDSPINVNSTAEVRQYLSEALNEIEQLAIAETTDKRKLEELASWRLGADPHPVAARCKTILNVRKAKKEVELYDKLLRAGKFHASFNVIGAMSSRMSGADGLNAQGINKTKVVRSKFPLAWEGYDLCGGDFSAFEITLADAVYNDFDLRMSILTGKKIHGLFGVLLFPGTTYEEILASEGTEDDMYTKAKSGVFAMIYGGNAETLNRNLGIPLHIAKEAFEQWGKMFPGIGRARERIYNLFCSMRQPGGIGTAVTWQEPSDYCETFLGFRRYFTLENKVCKELFALAQSPPKEWKQCPAKVVRRERVQTAAGAVASALYGAAFGLQQANMRAAANHEIQSPGGEITKFVQRKIWDLQPCGIHEFVVAPMNIHDEIECVTRPDYVDQVATVVKEAVESFREKVPLIGMKWCKAMKNWAEKKGGDDDMSSTVEVKYDREKLLESMRTAA
jgi:DNA polymerase I-like protein with 3'-5' exonuclease and polymerase domains